MKNFIALSTLIITASCTAAEQTQQTPSTAHPLATKLLDQKYEKLKALYTCYNPFKKAWFRPASEAHLNRRAEIANAKGDTHVAGLIHKQGYQNIVEHSLHFLWNYKAVLFFLAAITK
jgi:hypothetical protein